MDESAERFARLYDEHIWTVYGFFAYRLSSREDAEDLTQQTFERALGAWDTYDPTRSRSTTWLMAIAKNLLVDHYRADRSDRQQPIEDPELRPDLEPAGEEPARNLGLDPALETALSRLADRERELLALRFGADLSGPQIAEVTDLNLANVQQILSRSLRRLRTELEGGGADSPLPRSSSS